MVHTFCVRIRQILETLDIVQIVNSTGSCDTGTGDPQCFYISLCTSFSQPKITGISANSPPKATTDSAISHTSSNKPHSDSVAQKHYAVSSIAHVFFVGGLLLLISLFWTHTFVYFKSLKNLKHFCDSKHGCRWLQQYP